MRAKEFYFLREEEIDPKKLELIPFGTSKSNTDPIAIADLQKALIFLGYNIGSKKADGNLGPNTEAALRAFQHRNNIPITGLADEKTIEVMQDKLGQGKVSTKPEPEDKPTDKKEPEDKPTDKKEPEVSKPNVSPDQSDAETARLARTGKPSTPDIRPNIKPNLKPDLKGQVERPSADVKKPDIAKPNVQQPNIKPNLKPDLKGQVERPSPDVKTANVKKTYQLPKLAQHSVTGGKLGLVLDLIASIESKSGNYDTMYAGRHPEILNMTLLELRQFQRVWWRQLKAKFDARFAAKKEKLKGEEAKKPSTAAGRYQIMRHNILTYAERAGLDPKISKFSPQNQDKMAYAFLKEQGVDSWINGRMEDRDFLDNLAGIWAAFPDPDTGKSKHTGVGDNKSLISVDQALGMLELIRQSA